MLLGATGSNGDAWDAQPLPPNNTGPGYEFAVEFTLNSAQAVTTVSANLFGDLTNEFTMELIQGSLDTGSMEASNTFAINSNASRDFDLQVNATLAAGTYFLVVAQAPFDEDNVGWVVSSELPAGTVGTVTDGEWQRSLGSGGTWQFQDFFTGDFAVDGPGSSTTGGGTGSNVTPEPSSLPLALLGICALGFLVAKRKVAPIGSAS